MGWEKGHRRWCRLLGCAAAVFRCLGCCRCVLLPTLLPRLPSVVPWECLRSCLCLCPHRCRCRCCRLQEFLDQMLDPAYQRTAEYRTRMHKASAALNYRDRRAPVP